MRIDAQFLDRAFPGDSEMAHRMRAFDWSASELGSPHRWPQNLRAAIALCLTSRFPISVWWGPRLLLLYNDAYQPWLSEDKRSRALMRPGSEVWSEVWDMIGPMLDGVMATGVATWSADTELIYDRALRREEVFISWSFGPIIGDDGRTVDGVFCPSAENTEKVVGARRLETLRRLGTRSSDARTVDGACHEAAGVLRENSRDIPFAAVYVVDGDEARLAASVLPPSDHQLPRAVSSVTDDPGSPWPLAQVLRSKRAADCTNLEAHGIRIRGGDWPEFARDAVVVPIQAAHEQLAGLLMVGVSPRRPLDAAYRTFFDLIAGHIATAIADARAYAAEQQHAEALAELDRAKTTFFSNVSHEFRTPLTLLLGPLEEELPRDPPRHERLDVAHRNALRLLHLVNTLLDFSRIEAGRIEAVYEPTDLAAYTTELASVFRSAIEKAGLALVVDCPPLPEPIYVDREMWEKIVLNLLSNAFKFTFEGTIQVKLRWCGEQRVEFSVSDTGVGVPASDVPRMFERFHRVRGTRARTFEGTGIGLALVQELVRLHGGAISVQSEEDRGSQFSVLLRTGSAHLPKERVGAVRNLASTAIRAMPFVGETLRWLDHDVSVAAENEISPSLGSPTDTRPTLLLADHNADMRDYVRRLLNARFDVITVADGEAALAAARKHPFDLVLADVMMPRLDGFGLLKALREDPETHDVPVMLLSARAGEESRAEGLRAGADDYLIKPFSARELLVRVSARLEIARANRAAVERERELRKSAEEAEGMTRLHELSTRLMAKPEFQSVLEEVLDATISLLDADFGTVQLYDAGTHALQIVAQRGFQQDFLEYFSSVREGTGSCGAALERCERVIVEDVSTDPLFAPHLNVMAAAGVRAVQSTPLLSHRGDLLGIISTHFRSPHRPSARELRLLDLYGRQAAATIERKQAAEALRTSEERFRRYFELGLIGMTMTSPDKGILEVNDELCRIFGYERDELLGKSWAELTHPDDAAADVAQFDRVMAGEIDGYSMDKRWIRKDGRILYSIMAARCLRRPDRSVNCFVGLVQDITERKRVETETIALKNALATELAAMTRLHDFSTRLLEQTDIQDLLQEVLDAIVALQHADFGLLQLYRPDAQALDVVAHRGFRRDVLEDFSRVNAASRTACGRVLRDGARVIVEDVETDVMFAPYRQMAVAVGFRAVQSTPVFSRTGRLLGVISTHFRSPHRPSDDVLRMTDLYARQAAEMIESKQNEAALLRYQRELQDLTTRLIEAQEMQSKHLARELHDDFSQRLAAIGIEIAGLAHSPGDARQALSDRLLRLTEQIGAMARDIHRMSRQIHPSILDDLGLSAALKSECLAFSEQYGMSAEFTAESIPRDVPEAIALCLYRVAQESLRNIGRHAGVSEVRVTLRRRAGEIVLAIDDAGQGFDPERIKGKRGLGLVSMEERMRIVGGTLSIHSQPGAGTHVEARVPTMR